MRLKYAIAKKRRQLVKKIVESELVEKLYEGRSPNEGEC